MLREIIIKFKEKRRQFIKNDFNYDNDDKYYHADDLYDDYNIDEMMDMTNISIIVMMIHAYIPS